MNMNNTDYSDTNRFLFYPEWDRKDKMQYN